MSSPIERRVSMRTPSPRSWRWRVARFVLVAAVAWMAAVWFARHGFGWYSVRVTQRLPSPDGRFDAVVEHWDGGAAGENDRVFIERLWAKELVYHSKSFVEMRWVEPDRLVVVDAFAGNVDPRWERTSTVRVGLRSVTVDRLDEGR